MSFPVIASVHPLEDGICAFIWSIDGNISFSELVNVSLGHVGLSVGRDTTFIFYRKK